MDTPFSEEASLINTLSNPVVLITVILLVVGLIVAIYAIVHMMKRNDALAEIRGGKEGIYIVSKSPPFWIFIVMMSFVTFIFYSFLKWGGEENNYDGPVSTIHQAINNPVASFYENNHIYSWITPWLLIVNEAIAEHHHDKFVKGWIYLGTGDNPETWRFNFLDDGLARVDEDGSINGTVVVQAKTGMATPIREKNFGDFTGTILEFLNPEPKIVGTFKPLKCAKLIEYKSVGINKIWLHIDPITIPPDHILSDSCR